jgi:tocopherol O-methyltransferase
MTASVTHEHKVQEFYDVARFCYEAIMGEYWHHGDPDAVAMGLPRHRACQIFEERIIALCGLRSKEDEVLDFGSGLGGPTRHMARVTGARFIGVTNNDRLIQDARKKTARDGFSERQVSFQTIGDLDYKNLPFESGRFSAVTFFESVCHLSDKGAFFREAARVLKPGGRLAGIDWIQRPFGEHQTEEQILKFMGPVNKYIAMPAHGTVEDYKRYMEEAGLQVVIARDMFPNTKCWGSVQDDENPQWLGYDGPEAEVFREGEKALVAARDAGVFTVGMWAARKPA